MAKSKRITNLFLALAFSCFTCGAATIAAMPSLSISNEVTQVGEVEAAISELTSVIRDGKTFYQISDKDQLARVSKEIFEGSSEYANANFELTSDINLAGKVWTPIGSTANAYSGYFNGNGHIINGTVSADGFSADEYCGLFGYVAGAHIYDFVVGSFQYAHMDDTTGGANSCGRLIGYACDSVIADIYDESYMDSDNSEVRSLKTIGTIKNCSYYVGDSYIATNGAICKADSKNAAALTSIKPMFDWNSNSDSSKQGYSILVVTGDSKAYIQGEGEDKEIDYYRILVDTTGKVVGSDVAVSKNYLSDFATEYIIADAQNIPAAGDAVMKPVSGKKLTGWKAGGMSTTAKTVAEWFSLSGSRNLWVEPVLKDLSYNLKIVDSNGNAVTTIKDVAYNASWENVVSSITRSGYSLTKLYNAYVDGSTTTAGKTYYSATISYDSSYNKTETKTFTSGKSINHWDVSGKTSFDVKLYSDWIGNPVNTTVEFKNTNDSGATIDGSISDLEIKYDGEKPSGAPNLAIEQTGTTSGLYTFKAIADQSLVLTFKLKAGYKVASVACSPNGTVSHTLNSSTKVNTINISGLLTSSDRIVIEIVREETNITISSDSNITVSVSGNSSFTTCEGNKITTRVDEEFNIVATPAEGYQYYSYSHTGFESLSTPVVGSDDKVTFKVNMTIYSTSNTFTITSKQKTFKVSFEFSYEDYEADTSVKPGEITFTAGSSNIKTNANGGQTLTAVPSATLLAPSNAYYSVGTVLMTKSDGSSATITGEPGNYTIAGISGEDEITFKISYTKNEYNTTIKASFGKDMNSWTSVKDVNGNVASDTTKIIGFTPRTYKYKDTITLTYNIVDQYYEFVGWYYSNGDLISVDNNASVTADASDMTFYGVVKGKTATATLKSGDILANFDGTVGKYVSKTSAVNTGTKSLTYTYSSPEQASSAFTVDSVSGYYIYKGIIHKSDWSGVNEDNTLTGTEGTDYILFEVSGSPTTLTCSGYGDLPADVGDFIFNNSGCVIEYISAQKAVNLVFKAGAGASGEDFAGITYYYGGANVSVAGIKTRFTKKGYAAIGWEYYVSGTRYAQSDVSNGHEVNEMLFGNEILNIAKSNDYSTLSITRTYNAVTYTVALDQNGATTAGTASVRATYDSSTSFAITNPTKTGHTFRGWTAVKDSETIVINTNGELVKDIDDYTSSAGVWQHAEDVTLYAKWSAIQYDVTLNANGGSISNSTITFEYGEKMEGLNVVPTRTGFTFAGWYYIVGETTTLINTDTVFDSIVFTSGTFNADGGNSDITLFAKWSFEFDLTAKADVSVDYGAAITNQFEIKVAFNGQTKTIDAVSQEMPAGLKLNSWSWNPTNEKDKIYAPYILNVGSKDVTLTIALVDDGSLQELLKTTVTKSVNILFTINAVAMGAYVNSTTVQLNAIAANLKQLSVDTNAILKLVDDDNYIAGVSGGTWAHLETYVNSLVKDGVTSEQAWFYVMTKPMMAYKFMSLTDEAFSAAKFYKNTGLASMTFSEFLTKYNSAANVGISVGTNNDYFEYAMQKYVSTDASLNIGLSDNVKASVIANGVSKDVLVSVISNPNDTTCGKHTLSFQINVADIEGFNASNYTNLTQVSEGVYALNIGASNIIDNKIVQTYIYRNPVVFTLTETTAVARINPYEFSITSGTYTATVKTTSGEKGKYRYSDRKLIISSISPALEANEFAYIDGEFEIIEVPSSVGFSLYTITANEDRTGVTATLLQSPADNPLENATNYYITVNSVSVGSDSYAIVAGKQVYYDTNNRFVFQIANNGSLNPTIYVGAGSYKFNISVASVNPIANRHLIELVQWSSSYDYAALLKSKSSFAAGAFSQDLDMTVEEKSSNTITVVYSEAAYVTISSAPETSFNSGAYYVNFSDNEFTVPVSSEKTAYVLNEWTSAKGSTITSGKVALAAVPTETLTAKYTLAVPSVAVSKVSANAKDNVTLDSIASSNITISNSDDAITYTYTWFKKVDGNYTAITNIPATAHSNGTYAVKVKAAKSGYSAVESDYVDFEVEFSKLSISLAATKTEETYNNTDFAKSGFEITATGGINETYTIAQLLAENGKADKDRLFEVTLKKNGVNVTEIKDAGTYSLTIALYNSSNDDNANYSKYLYDSFSKEFTFTIHAAKIEYSKYYNNDTKFQKSFREIDPSLTLNLELNNETVIVTYTRTEGESVGNYDLLSASVSNSNYLLVASDNTTSAVVSLPAGNKHFEITKIEGIRITASIDGEKYETPYAGERNLVVTAQYNSDSKTWSLVLKDGESVLKTWALTTFVEVSSAGEETTLTDLSETTLSGITFSVDGTVKDKGTYSIVSSGKNDNYGAGFAFRNSAAVIEITQKQISLSNIEKEFDQTTAFDSSINNNIVTIEGLVATEKVVVKGQFANIGVGDSIAVSGLEISGEAAGNYRLSGTTSTGKIKKSSKKIEFATTKTSYTYGEIKQGLSEVVVTATIDGQSVEDYVTTAISIETATYSTGNFLNKGTYSLKISPTSAYYTVEEKNIEISVAELSISAYVENITKIYDGNDSVKQTIVLENILKNDVVTAYGKYSTKVPGEGIAVTFNLDGADKGNYVLSNATATGTITRAVVNVSAEINTISFVDNALAAGTTSFSIAYPFENTASDAYNSITQPTKTGYKFAGWSYGESKTKLTEENISTALENALGTDGLTIYADWTINTYTITIAINDEQGSYDAVPQGTKVNKVHTYNYFDTVTITAAAKTGYVALNGTQQVVNITENKEISVEFRAAQITFIVSVDKSELYPYESTEITFGENWTKASDGASASRIIAYTELGSLAAKDFLPAINVKGYTLEAWISGGNRVKTNATGTLKDLILALNSSFVSDIELNFTTSFTANGHVVSFNPNGGAENPTSINVTYGVPIGELPSVTKDGYDFGGWTNGDRTFTSATIFDYDEDITLTAVWTIGIYGIKIEVENASIDIKDSMNIAVLPDDDGVYKLSFSKTYTITITANPGYKVASLSETKGNCDFSYVLEGDNAVGQIKDIKGTSEIEVSTLAKENNFEITVNKATVDVFVGGIEILKDASPEEGTDGQLKPITFKAKTNQKVEIVVSPEKGYDVSLKSLSGATSTQDGNKYTIEGFTTDVSMVYEETAQNHTVTFVFNDGVAGIDEYQGAEKQTETTFVVKTGVPFLVVFNYSYGYEFGSVETQPEMIIKDKDGFIEITGFTEDFTMTIRPKKKIFSLTKIIYALDQKGNNTTTDEFSVEAPESAEYLSEVSFVAKKNDSVSGYSFVGWFEGLISQNSDGTFAYDLNKRVSEDLEYNRQVNGEIILTAVFQYAEFDVTASVSGTGVINKGGKTVASAGKEYKKSFYYGTTINLEAEADPGFEFDCWIVNDEEKGNDTTLTISVDADLIIIAKFSAKELKIQVDTVVSISGVRYGGDYIKGLEYGSIESGTYEDGTFAPNSSSSTDGLPLKITTYSGAKTYIRVIAKKGYVSEGALHKSNNTPNDVVINLIGEQTKDEAGNTVSIFEIDKYNAENDGRYIFTAVFVAESSTVNIVYRDEDTNVDVGHIVVATGEGISVSGNSSSKVVVDVVTGKELKVVASVRFGTSFALDESSNYKIGAGELTISNIEKSDEDLTAKGFSDRITFNVSGFVGENVEVVIYVKATTYTVRLVDYDEEGNAIFDKIIDGVKEGQLLNLNGVEKPEKTGYAFNGFYTYQGGAGKQYINKDWESVVWEENGYSWNGTEYVKDTNYDNATKQFTLYASYRINKTKITIDAVPTDLKEVPPTVAAKVVVTSLNEANSWTIDSEKFMAEILYSAKLDIAAPVYEKYKFAYWKIVRTDENGNVSTEEVRKEVVENLNHQNYPEITIYAVYDVYISISRNDGGTVSFTYVDHENKQQKTEEYYDEKEGIIFPQAYVPVSTEITLKAEIQDGYEFLGWFDENGALISSLTEYSIERVGEDPTLSQYYYAKFKGKKVTLYIGEYDSTGGHIVDITIDDERFDGTAVRLETQIGSKITFNIFRRSNYEFVFEGAEVVKEGDSYVYVVDFNDIDPQTYSLTLTPIFTQLMCDVQINVKLIGDDIKENEMPLAGVVAYYDADGNRKIVQDGQLTINDKVGREITLEVIPSTNYKIASIIHDDQDVTGQLKAGKIVLKINLNEYDIVNEGGLNVINIEFQRDLWTDLVNESYTINGEGTKANPYYITSAEDLAFVAYMVNIMKNADYTNAHYKLTTNISLLGKYWGPIGTENNPFNGKFNFDVFEIGDVSLVYGYTGDCDTTKVFGYLGPDAELTEANQELKIILIVVGVVLGVTIIAVLIFIILRIKRRRKMEELQNG